VLAYLEIFEIFEQARRKSGLKNSAPGRGEMNLELGYVKRRKWSWTEKRQQQAADVVDIVNALMEYHPLTVRQIFYQLVAACTAPGFLDTSYF
jgi:hypothetical protein